MVLINALKVKERMLGETAGKLLVVEIDKLNPDPNPDPNLAAILEDPTLEGATLTLEDQEMEDADSQVVRGSVTL